MNVRAPRLSKAPRVPRKQAERSADTRERIIAAVIECIGEIGFARTTAAEIGRRAGVTWGAVQHHFGGKDAILSAVLEDTFNRFATRFENLPIADSTLSDRVSLFVDRAWEHFDSAHYRTTLEILLHNLSDTTDDAESLPRQMLESWDTLWTRVFGESNLPLRQRLALERFTIALLSGLAINRTLQGAGATMPIDALDILKSTLIRGLEGRGS